MICMERSLALKWKSLLKNFPCLVEPCHQKGILSDKCKQGIRRANAVQGGSCNKQLFSLIIIELPSLSKHFKDVNEYIHKIKELRYKSVPFWRECSVPDFAVPLKTTPQFWGIGIHRIKHKLVTKRPFTEMDNNTKESLKAMIHYLKCHQSLY